MTAAVIAELNRRWFALCARWGIVPPLDERGELTRTETMGVPERTEVLEATPSTSAVV